MAHRFAISPEDAEDFVQELRLSVWRAGERPLTASWIFRAAEHCAIDILRGKRRRERLMRLGLTDHQVDARELEQILKASVSRLPAALRAFYQTRLVEGFSERETAKHIGVSRKIVRRMDAYCRRLLSRGR